MSIPPVSTPALSGLLSSESPKDNKREKTDSPELITLSELTTLPKLTLPALKSSLPELTVLPKLTTSPKLIKKHVIQQIERMVKIVILFAVWGLKQGVVQALDTKNIHMREKALLYTAS